MKFQTEDTYRDWLLRGLRLRLGSHAVVLDSKNVSDVVICIDTPNGPRALFLEVKYAKESAGRIGIGDAVGSGFQPEILIKRPTYFEVYTRWLIASDDGWAVLVDNTTVRNHAAGGAVATGKQNNIRDSVFQDHRCFRIDDSVEEVAAWVESTARGLTPP